MRHCMIGVPKEVKPGEGRVGITPDGVRALCALRALGIDVEIGVEKEAGVLSGFSDADYLTAGALTYLDIKALYRDADFVIKVKELTPEEYWLIPLLEGKIIFAFFHLAGGDPELIRLLLKHHVTVIAYENVTKVVDGRTILPLLAPMSVIAGTQSARIALLRHPKERHGELEGLMLGGGVVCEASLNEMLVKNVGSISMFESREERLLELRAKYEKEPTFSVFPFSFFESKGGKELLRGADIVISGVKLPDAAAAPHVLTQKHFRIMKPGAYIADVAIDQGGSTAWSKVTKPGETFTRGKRGLVFSCVPNIPGSTVPVEATEALTKATYPYIELIAKHLVESDKGIYWALKDNPDLRAGLQTWQGMLTNRAVAEKHGMTGWQYFKSLDAIF